MTAREGSVRTLILGLLLLMTAVVPAAARLEPALTKVEIERQIEPRVRIVYQTELAFLRAAAEPTAARFAEIERQSEPAFREMVKGYVELLYDNAHERIPRTTEDPDDRLLGRLLGLAREVLPADQADRYQRQLDGRAVARKRTIIAAMVSGVDHHLFLSEDQRRRLGEALDRHWNPKWTDGVLWSSSGDEPMFPVPARLLVPLLSGPQKVMWSKVEKSSDRLVAGLWLNNISHLRGSVLFPPAEKPAEAEKPEEKPGPDAKAEPGTPAAPVDAVEEQEAGHDAPAEAEEGGPGPEGPKAVRPKLVWNAQPFEQEVFRKMSGGRVEDWLDALLDLNADYVDRVCQLAGDQKRKIRLAGAGDVARYLNRFNGVKRGYENASSDNELQTVIEPQMFSLERKIDGPFFDETSLFMRAIPTTLTPDQLGQYRAAVAGRHAFRNRAVVRYTVTALERFMPLMPLLENQRESLSSLLMAELPAPRRFDRQAVSMTQIRLGLIPDEKLRPLVNEFQWKLLTVKLALVRQGFIQANMSKWLERADQPSTED